MKNRLKSIFEFLNENQAYNTKIQLGFYQDTLFPYKDSHSKVRSLLWRVQASQSQPRLNNVAKFWQEIEGKKISSFESLLLSLNGDPDDKSYFNLFNSLKQNPSWGNKTAALFVRSLYHVHVDKRYIQYSFLDNTPKELSETDRIFLPVDIVISNIFTSIFGNKKFSFEKINYDLLKDYCDERMAIWDDLWFWGFITQKGSGSQRQLSWNEEKYWSLLHTPKDVNSIAEVETRAIEFIELIKS